MRSERYFFLLLLLVLLLTTPKPGWSAKEAAGPAGDAAAAAGKEAEDEETTGRGQGFEPRPPEEECPATFGPIITDAAVPIEKGELRHPAYLGAFFCHRFFFPKLAAGLSRRGLYGL